MALKLITPPDPFITLAEAKAHVRAVDFTDDDAFLTSAAAAACAHIDLRDGITAVGPQTWELQLDSFPAAEIQIPLRPLIEVDSVKYDDADGVEQTVSIDDYEVDTVSADGWVVLASGVSWPTTIDTINVVRVQFEAGHVTIPVAFKQAALLLVAHWYENREAVIIGQAPTELPLGVDALTARYHSWFV